MTDVQAGLTIDPIVVRRRRAMTGWRQSVVPSAHFAKRPTPRAGDPVSQRARGAQLDDWRCT